MTNLKAYTAAQMRGLEKIAITDGVSEYELMCRAGGWAASELMCRSKSRDHFLVLCGPGNNGGDGYVIAARLKSAWHNVTVMSVADPSLLTGAAAQARDAWLKLGGAIEGWQGVLPAADVFVDAIFGTGLKRRIEGAYLDLALALNHTPSDVIAIDVPTGLCCDTGRQLGAAVVARQTLTFIGYKLGQLTSDGPDYCGEIVLDSLSITADVFAQVDGVDLISPDIINELAARRKNAHKGQFGHAVLIGGSPGMQGAIRLSAESALRCGAGMVTIITHPAHANYISLDRPEIMVSSARSVSEVLPLLDGADVFAVGPGLDDDGWARQWIPALLKYSKPVVVDAGALDKLADFLPLGRQDIVLTPHPGEAARMLNCTSKLIQDNRLKALNDLIHISQCTVLLKGRGTLVGSSKQRSMCTLGNSGMATAGMGDVLTGVLVALMAQGLSTLTATRMGVYLHAAAADFAAADQPVGMIASDLLPYLRALINGASCPK